MTAESVIMHAALGKQIGLLFTQWAEWRDWARTHAEQIEKTDGHAGLFRATWTNGGRIHAVTMDSISICIALNLDAYFVSEGVRFCDPEQVLKCMDMLDTRVRTEIL